MGSTIGVYWVVVLDNFGELEVTGNEIVGNYSYDRQWLVGNI